jgi:hypothetical protein
MKLFQTLTTPTILGFVRLRMNRKRLERIKSLSNQNLIETELIPFDPDATKQALNKYKLFIQ